MLPTYMRNCQIVMCDLFTNSVSKGLSVAWPTENPWLTILSNIGTTHKNLTVENIGWEHLLKQVFPFPSILFVMIIFL